MAKDFSIELQGSQELMNFFSDLPSQFGQKVLGDIAQKGASVIRSEARRQMPIDGELGRIGKKAVIIGRSKSNRTERVVTVGNTYFTYKGQHVSLGKIIRHMTSGTQNLRMTKSRRIRGRVGLRLGDFIHKAFLLRREQAIRVMGESTFKIIERRARRVKGLQYGR